MKRTWMLALLAAILTATACSSDDGSGLPDSDQGKVQFSCQTTGVINKVVARATEGYQLPAEVIPDADAFALTIQGIYTEKVDGGTADRTYEKSWLSLADYNLEAPELEAGIYDAVNHHYTNSYEATVTYGDLAVEGEGKASFKGYSVDAAGVAAPFIIYAGSTPTQVQILAKLSNSCFTLAVTDWMLNYYTNIELTIHTATNSFTFTPTTTAVSSLIFIAPDQQIAFSGKAVKAQNGVEVTFPKTTIGTSAVKAETHYAVQVDHSTAGSGALSILFDGSFTDVPAIDVELNPDEN